MKLKIYLLGLVALCAAVFMPVTPAHGQVDNALMSALVKKGVLSDQEAEDILSQEQKDYSSTAASKINLSTSIKSITFYGDLRLRYELRDGTVSQGDLNGSNQVYNHNDSQSRSRWRYRLRFGVKGDLYDNFFYGIRLSSGQKYDRSGNVTFGDTQNGGEFGNSQSLLDIDRVYLGWKPTDYLTLIGGKMENPLYTTNLVWDDNLSPTGAAEVFDKKITDHVELFGTAGQFVYADSADNTANISSGKENFDDLFMFAEEVGVKYNIDANTFYKGAVAFYSYSGTNNGNASNTVGGNYATSGMFGFSNSNNSPSYYQGPFVGVSSSPGSNVVGINDLAVLETPMEFDFKIGPGVHTTTKGDPRDMKGVVTEETTGWQIPMRVFGDFAYNFEANARADQARAAIDGFAANVANNASTTTGNVGVTAPTPLGSQTQAQANTAFLNSNSVQGVLNSGKALLDQAAYQVGIEAGQLKKKGDWDGKLYWQSTGYYAVDPNLIDADIFNAAPNMEGVVVAVSHNWTDGVSSTLKYAYANPVNNKLATPNVNQDLQTSTIHEYNLFQADLMWKF